MVIPRPVHRDLVPPKRVPKRRLCRSPGGVRCARSESRASTRPVDWQHCKRVDLRSRRHRPSRCFTAAWIAARLGEFGTVGGLVPDGFDQYLLVRPAWLAEGDCGGDDAEQTATIASVAQRHTTTTDLIRFGIWEGYGWASSTTLYSVSGPRLSAWFVRAWIRGRSRLADRRRHRRIRQGLEQVPQFDLPCRRYYLLHGQLQAAACIVDPGGCRHQVPDLWWPDDRQWFVATDTDLDWTYIAGSRTFIAEIIAAFPERTEIVNRDTPNNLFM